MAEVVIHVCITDHVRPLVRVLIEVMTNRSSEKEGRAVETEGNSPEAIYDNVVDREGLCGITDP